MEASAVAALTGVLQGLMDAENGNFFVGAVPLNDYPDYTSIIKRPMDLLAVKNKLAAGDYKSAEALARDVRRTFLNAMIYSRTRFAIVAKTARALLDRFEADLARARRDTPALRSPSLSEPRRAKACAAALSAVKKHKAEGGKRPLASPFLVALDPSRFIGYELIVKKPMDLVKVEARLKGSGGDRYATVADFVRDVRLTLSNALRFNQALEDMAENGIRCAAVELCRLFDDHCGAAGFDVLPCDTWRDCCACTDALLRACDDRGMVEEMLLFLFPINYYFNGGEPPNYGKHVKVRTSVSEALARVLEGKTRTDVAFLRDMLRIFQNCETYWRAMRKTEPEDAATYIDYAQKCGGLLVEVAGEVFGP
eukprot:CAMPEP_0118862590 /NCGR_PEP_ID=MMETSP1163-20130328/7738_1 /TAXON_ID=124430 /ORGANISM="Phaeomonas parva, Strain CCMP2877" /LENGTH=366 /DNA_ID=CAMNT_0006796507 /DNA_START=61 /DNA_END=1158 /DNA_ORIENTATION=-